MSHDSGDAQSHPVAWDERCEDLFDYVKQQIPARARLAGDRLVKGAICLSVQDWPSKELRSCSGDSKQSRLLTQSTARWVTKTLRDSEKNVGSLVALFLPMIVSAIVEVILKWWSLNNRNQRLVSQVQSALGRRNR